MDRARELGGLLWVGLGAVTLVTWMIMFDGSIGPVSAGLTVLSVAAGVAFAAPAPPAARWWAGRAIGVVLGLDLLAAIADRLGAFGRPGDPGVSWGSWTSFVDYTHQLAPWLPAPEVIAVGATAVEAVLGILLVHGAWWRWVGKAAAGLLTVYLLLMTVSLGLGSALEYAVPVLVGGALLASARGDRPGRRVYVEPAAGERVAR